MWKLILFTVTAGIVGTALGGLLGVLFQRARERTMSFVLSFAAGIMLSLVCFELLPEATENGNLALTAFSALAGMLVILLLNRLVDRRGGGHAHAHVHAHAASQPCDEACESDSRRAMLKAGVILLAALAVHNFPEGFAMGAGMAGEDSSAFGVRVMLLIALHNIPDGMAIALSLMMGGVNRWKALCFTALSGVPTVVGGVLGYLLGGLSPLAVAVSLAAAGGALVYVTFCEIMPQTIRLNRGEAPALFAVVGVLAGMVISGLAL